MKRLLCLILALAMIACFFAGCDSDPVASDDPQIDTPDTGNNNDNNDTPVVDDKLFPELDELVTVTFWHSVTNETVYAAFEEVVNNFNNGIGKEKNVYVELVQYSSAAELNTAVTGAIMSNSAPDIVMGSSIYMVEYMSAEALVNLTPYIEHEEYGMDMSDIYDCWLLNCNNYDEAHNYYCMPILAYSEVMYYNVDFFENNNLTVPTTWEEAEAVSREASAIIGKGALGWDNACKMFTTLAEQTGVGYTDPQGNLLFADDLDTVLEKVQWYVDLVDEGVFRTPGDSYYFSGPFANQEIPMYIGSGVEGAYIDMKIDPANPFTWDCATVPYFEGSDPATFSECNLLAVVDQGEDYKARLASWEFLKYFESTEAVLTMAGAGAYIPVLKSVAEDPAWQATASPAQLVGVEQMSSYYAFYGFDNGEYTSSAIYTDLKTTCETVLGNGDDLRSSIENLLTLYNR